MTSARRRGWGHNRATTGPLSQSVTGSATTTAAASGPVAALTAMLYEHGIALEMMSFHQMPANGETATFIRGGDDYHAEWAMGLDEDATQSALRAVIACANRLVSAG